MDCFFPSLTGLKYQKALIASCALGALLTTAPLEAYATNAASPVVKEVMQQQVKITGHVQGNNGWELPGVNIAVKGQPGVGTTTDLDGNYTLNVAPNATLVFSYIGYIAKEVQVNGKTTLNVTLDEDTEQLDEVVVVGYGKMKKGDLSAAVASVANVDKLKERPIANAAEMLQGQIPGVTVVANGGHTGSEPTITIRGMGSRTGESVLYVVDGVPGAPFNFSDVVSMTVLKDAASAAIYGAYAGSAGVILVTTKQASEGATSVEYNVVTGFSRASNLPQSLTIEEERKVRAAALGGEQYLPDGWDVAKNPYIGQTRTDWIDEIFRDAPFQRHNVILSGGNENFSNRASVEFSDRQGTLENTYKKGVITRINSMFKINKWVRVREDFTWRDTQSKDANTSSAQSGAILAALMMPRNAEVYTSDGSYGGTAPSDPEYIAKYGNNFADIHGDAINPVRILKSAYDENHYSTVNTSTFLDIMEPIRGLNFTSRFSYKLNNYFSRYYNTRRLEPGKPNNNNNLSYNSSRDYSWDFENTANYDRVFNRHNVGLMASTTASESKYRSFYVNGKDFESEEEALMYFAQAGSFDPASDSYSCDRNVSFVGRASYSYADRYFVTASWRRDYAGRLPQGQKYGDFPSATLAWKLTSEEFMPKIDALNTLKLRASWGRIGNLGSVWLGYSYPTLSKSGGGDVGGQVGATTPIVTGRYNGVGYNPLLTWETSEQLDLGLDAVMFNNRLNLTVDYFDKKTMDLIKEQEGGWTTNIGISPMYINEGEISNRGIEVAANWTDKVGNVNYWVGGNMATLRNRVTNIGKADADGNKPVWTDGGSYRDLNPFRTEEGRPLYSFYVIESQGVFKTQSEVDNYKNEKGELIQPDAAVGDLKFVDFNHDGEISDADRQFMGNAMPDLTYSLSGGLGWKDFSFNLMLQGVAGVKLFNGYKQTVLNESLSSFNRSRDILKALDGPNDDVPRISSSDPNKNFTRVSSYFLEDGDYLRIKNITLGYSFTRLLQKNGYLLDRKSTLDLTLSVDNLFTFTKYSGIDPEVGGVGLDGGQYPVSRTFSVGVKMKF
ncbi:MAG: TonB-dependent receptor [Bacteroidales bacterium]|nr:TonB-dependent receptor [Bacteroidales bacterium]